MSRSPFGAKQRFMTAVRELVSEGIYPSPCAINAKLGRGGKDSRQRNNINGRECEWREEILVSLGWTYRPDLRTSDGRTWVPPASAVRA